MFSIRSMIRILNLLSLMLLVLLPFQMVKAATGVGKLSSVKSGSGKPSKVSAVHSKKSIKRSVASVSPSDSSIQITQNFDTSGRVISEILTADDLIEFTTNPKGDGVHEVWEISKPKQGVVFRAKNPLNGRYQTIEIEKQKDGGRVLLRYAYNSKTKVFDLKESKFKKDWPMFAAILDKKDESGKFVATCGEAPSIYSEANNWLDIVKTISAGSKSRSQQIMSCYMKRYRDAFFDSNCFGGNFQSSFNDLRNGIVDVMASSVPSDGKPVYLQCLTQQGFSTHSTKIQAQISSLTRSLQAVIKDDSEMTKTNGDLDEMLKLCDKPYHVGLLPGRITAPFSCELNNTSGEMAEFRPDSNGGDQIVFHRTSSNILENKSLVSDYGLPTTPTSDVYASYFFHEFLHKSGIENETIVYGLQNCCDGRKGEHSGDCAKAQKYAGDTDISNKYIGIFDKFPGFGIAQANNMLAFQSDSNLQAAMMDSYYSGFDSHKETAGASYKSCTASEKCDANCKNECSKAYLNEMAKFTQEWFNDPNYCPLYRSRAKDPAPIDCAKLGSELAVVVRKASDSNIVGEADAARSSIQEMKAVVRSGGLSNYAVIAPAGQLNVITGEANNQTPSKGSIADATKPIASAPAGPAVPAPAPSARMPSSLGLADKGSATEAGRVTGAETSVGAGTGRRPAAPSISGAVAGSPQIAAQAARRVAASEGLANRAGVISNLFVPSASARISGSNRESAASLSGLDVSAPSSARAPISVDFDSKLGTMQIQSPVPTSTAASRSLVAAAVAAQPSGAPAATSSGVRSGAPASSGAFSGESTVVDSGDAPVAKSHGGSKKEQASGGSGYSNSKRNGTSGTTAPGTAPLSSSASGSAGAQASPNLESKSREVMSAESVKKILLGNYNGAHKLLTGPVNSEFNSAMRKLRIRVTEITSDNQTKNYGPSDANIRYCIKPGRSGNEGSCE